MQSQHFIYKLKKKNGKFNEDYNTHPKNVQISYV